MGGLVEFFAQAPIFNLAEAFGIGGDKKKRPPPASPAPPATDLERQSQQADTAARQRLTARRRGSGRQTVLSLGGAFDRENVSRPLLGGNA